MGLLDVLFGGKKKKEKIREMIASGAKVIDVRSAGEFHSGHAQGSVNIPLDQVQRRIKEITSSGKPVVVCCASGMRSAVAAGTLQKYGVEVVNAGSWRNLEFK